MVEFELAAFFFKLHLVANRYPVLDVLERIVVVEVSGKD